MAAILGISAFYHDSAAALVVDGEIVAAAQEERFTRKKHDARFPALAIEYCLREAGLTQADLDHAVFYDKPLVKLDRLLETYLSFAPSGLRSFSMALPLWLKDRLFMRRTIRKGLSEATRARLLFCGHHESHAASAFFPSPFDRAAILTLDGVGEWSTATFGIGEGNRIHLIKEIRFPHSLGLLYSAFTYYCGFKVNSGEYKLMGLAPYGRPLYRDLIYQHLLDVKPDGSFWLNMEFFNYCQGLTMTGRRFAEIFGGPARQPESQIEQRHFDLAASIQAVTEDIMMRIAHHVHAETGMEHLVLAGGVALNCVANGKLLRDGPFESIWIQPAAGDAGGALGAALLVHHQLMDRPRARRTVDAQQGSFLGPRFEPAAIRSEVLRGIPHEELDQAALDDRVAALLADGKVVGWFAGRMEFGPRALGGRSILGDPRSPRMQAVMNLKIKFRESFRPFAPCVLAEHAHEWFGLPRGQESPYMLLVAPVLERHLVALGDEERAIMMDDPDLCRRVNVVRSTVPAVTHVDYSARVQTVDAQRNPRLHRLLSAFHRLTGCPVLVNTSFNVRGEPIVCTPTDAYRCFLATEMDALVLENLLVQKSDVPQILAEEARQEHVAQFQLD
jgi:carbamoyltransferase